MNTFRRLTLAVSTLLLGSTLGCNLTSTMSGDSINLNTRSRVKKDGGGHEVVRRSETWDPERTALVICDMWDAHWCQGAANRVIEMAPVVNRVVKNARERGVFVIHAPSSVVSFYDGAPGRELAKRSPHSPTPVPLSTEDRWGTKWCYPPDGEPPMPIDDSDMGCDCKVKCKLPEGNGPWTRQIDSIEIVEGDAITDHGQETWNLLAERDIDNVLIMGVHLNMCVLGRPFGIRQMVNVGKNIVLVRDLTDTMYNSRMKPFVNHFDGTDLVVEHVEKHWCPTVLSTDISGGEPFRFREDQRGKE